jgi:hypothetical protein
MRFARRPHSRTVRASATVTVLTCMMLAATAGLALGGIRTKNCARISGCATSLSSPPILTAAPPPGGTAPPPAPTSRLAVAVKTAPTSSRGAGNQSGRLVEKVDVGRGITCPGYTARDTSTFGFQLLTATPMNITYVITDRIKNTTADGIHFCLAAKFRFKTASGRQAAATRLPDGTRGHLGVLPQCAIPVLPPDLATAPCVEQITTTKDLNSSTGVDVILRVRVPTRTKGGDPWGGG